MPIKYLRQIITILGLCAVAALIAIRPAHAEVKVPSCDVAEAWALSIDPKDR